MTSPHSLPQPSQDTVMNDKRTTPTGEINDVGIMAKRLREWVHGRFGVWITFATAMRAIRYVLRGEK